MSSLLERYQHHVAALEAEGVDLVYYGCPHCGESIATRVPPLPGETYDSLATCPYCERLHLYAVDSGGRMSIYSMGGART